MINLDLDTGVIYFVKFFNSDSHLSNCFRERGQVRAAPVQRPPEAGGLLAAVSARSLPPGNGLTSRNPGCDRTGPPVTIICFFEALEAYGLWIECLLSK